MNNPVFLETIETSEPGGFCILALGSIPFVMPFGVELSPDQAQALEAARLQAQAGRAKVAAAIVAQIQRDLGVTPEMHVAGLTAGAATLAGAHMRARIAGAMIERRRAEALMRPLTPPQFNEAVEANIQAIDKATAALEAAREAKNRAAVTAALTDLRRANARVARLRGEQLDRAWVGQAETETLVLAQARGETTDWYTDGGASAVRIKTRDGLWTAYESGSLSKSQAAMGLKYRNGYEAQAAGLKIADMEAAMAGGRSSPVHGGLQRTKAELARAKLLAGLSRYEAAVAPGRDLAVLRAVAGRGETIFSLGRSGGSRAANLAALSRALDALIDSGDPAGRSGL